MVVNGLKERCFTGDYDDVVLSDVAGEVKATLTVGTENVLEEIYYPDANNMIYIRDLGTILQSYFNFDELSLANLNKPTLLSALITFDPAVTTPQQSVFYSNVRTGIDLEQPFHNFLTRYRKKKTSFTRQEMISFYQNGQTIELGIAYLTSAKPKYEKFEWIGASTSGNCVTRNVSPATILSILTGRVGSVASDKLIYFDLYAKDGSTVVDRVRFEIDNRYFPQETHFLYRNCFGVPETMTFTGLDEQEIEMEGTFNYINRNYRKTYTEAVKMHTSNSGYINEGQGESIEDMIRSEKIFLIEGGAVGDEIVITDVDMKLDKPRNQPIDYTITWRPTLIDQFKFRKHGQEKVRIFDKTFDYTYE